MQAKKVGVIIPIYNVERYLRQCLDSVIHQTYANLSIILVNDGSTDKSFEIAKEYALKDERIIIIDKENGGLSSARNAGIEFFSGDYVLKFNENLSQNSIFKHFEISNSNTLCIKQILASRLENTRFKYTQDKCLNLKANLNLQDFIIPDIEYLLFLDSDDYWDLSLVEACMRKSANVDIVWFDLNMFFEGKHNQKPETHFENFTQKRPIQEQIISKQDFIQHMLKYKISSFWFAWGGAILFSLIRLNKIKFSNGYFFEDTSFGIKLFCCANSIYILPRKLYHYRIRPDSIMTSFFDVNKISIPAHAKFIYESFNDVFQAKNYHYKASWAKICFDIVDFIDQLKDERLKLFISHQFLPSYIHHVYALLYFSKDPFELLPQFEKLKPYIKENLSFLGANERIKSSLTYRLGEIILQVKGFKTFLKLPFALKKELKAHKEQQKLYRETIKKFPFMVLPPLKEYIDYEEALRIYGHLTYRLGNAILKVLKFWFLGSYLILPFALALIAFRYKKDKARQIYLKTHLENKIQNLISENHVQQYYIHKLLDLGKKNHVEYEPMYLLSRIKKLQAQNKLGVKYQKLLYEHVIKAQNPIIIDTSKDYEALLKLALEYNHDLVAYAFEPNEYRYRLIQNELLSYKKVILDENAKFGRQKTSFILYSHLAYCKNEHLRLLIENGNFLKADLHIMPDLSEVPESINIRAINFVDTLKELLDRHQKIHFLRLNIDRGNEVLIHHIIKEMFYKKIDCIVCEVRDIIIDKEVWFKDLFNILKDRAIKNIFIDISQELRSDKK